MTGADQGLDDYAPPSVRHHFTRRTRVSLELPFDWEEDESAADDNTAVYVWADDDVDDTAEADGGESGDGGRPRPRIVVALYPAPPGSVDAALRIGEKVVAQLGGTPPGASDDGVEEVEADGFRGERRTFACQLPQGEDARVRLTLFQVGDFVASLLAILPVWRGDIDPLVASFDAAVESVRFIPVSA